MITRGRGTDPLDPVPFITPWHTGRGGPCHVTRCLLHHPVEQIHCVARTDHLSHPSVTPSWPRFLSSLCLLSRLYHVYLPTGTLVLGQAFNSLLPCRSDLASLCTDTNVVHDFQSFKSIVKQGKKVFIYYPWLLCGENHTSSSGKKLWRWGPNI